MVVVMMKILYIQVTKISKTVPIFNFNGSKLKSWFNYSFEFDQLFINFVINLTFFSIILE
ncbi:MAG TPA: hypothetical protein DCF68_09185 [Cyanothece sp. UBA12306]|nr:hypothetical protein [Cyanothece sp. UBA12306]